MCVGGSLQAQVCGQRLAVPGWHEGGAARQRSSPRVCTAIRPAQPGAQARRPECLRLWPADRGRLHAANNGLQSSRPGTKGCLSSAGVCVPGRVRCSLGGAGRGLQTWRLSAVWRVVRVGGGTRSCLLGPSKPVLGEDWEEGVQGPAGWGRGWGGDRAWELLRWPWGQEAEGLLIGHPQDTQGLGPQYGAAQEIRVHRALGPLPSLLEGCLASPECPCLSASPGMVTLAHTSP